MSFIYVISSNLYEDRIYIIKATRPKNQIIKNLINNVIDIFLEETRFKRYRSENLDIFSEHNCNLEIRESYILEKNKNKIVFENISKQKTENSENLITFEIIKKSNTGSLNKLKTFSLDCVDLNEHLLYLRNKTQENIEIYNKTNSKEIYQDIISFSDNFIKKWSIIKVRDLISMNNDFQKFLKDIGSCSKDCTEHSINITYLNKDFYNKYIEPVKNLFTATQKNNLAELFHDIESRPLTEAIYNLDYKKVNNFLINNPNFDINKQHGPLKITLLMFSLSRCYRCNNQNVKKDSENLKQIIHTLLIFNADKTLLDVFKRSALEYLENGTIMFDIGYMLGPTHNPNSSSCHVLPLTDTFEQDVKKMFLTSEPLKEINKEDDIQTVIDKSRGNQWSQIKNNLVNK